MAKENKTIKRAEIEKYALDYANLKHKPSSGVPNKGIQNFYDCKHSFIAGFDLAEKIMFSKEELFNLTLDAVDLGMTLRQNQLSGYAQKSGKEIHQEWFENIKKIINENS